MEELGKFQHLLTNETGQFFDKECSSKTHSKTQYCMNRSHSKQVSWCHAVSSSSKGLS